MGRSLPGRISEKGDEFFLGSDFARGGVVRELLKKGERMRNILLANVPSRVERFSPNLIGEAIIHQPDSTVKALLEIIDVLITHCFLHDTMDG